MPDPKFRSGFEGEVITGHMPFLLSNQQQQSTEALFLLPLSALGFAALYNIPLY